MGFQKGYFSKFLPYSESQSLKFLNPNNTDKNLKISYSKILSIDSYSNGIGLQKDGTNYKPMFFE